MSRVVALWSLFTRVAPRRATSLPASLSCQSTRTHLYTLYIIPNPRLNTAFSHLLYSKKFYYILYSLLQHLIAPASTRQLIYTRHPFLPANATWPSTTRDEPPQHTLQYESQAQAFLIGASLVAALVCIGIQLAAWQRPFHGGLYAAHGARQPVPSAQPYDEAVPRQQAISGRNSP